MENYFKVIVVLSMILIACNSATIENKSVESNTTDTEAVSEVQPQVNVFLEGLYIPWGMDFLPNGDFIFTERNGKIKIVREGSKQAEILTTRNVIESEGGLLGLAVDPDFKKTGFIFIYETTTSNRVVRLALSNGSIKEDKVIVEGIPKARYHDGGALAFGPDGYLYIGTGDAGDPDLSQEINSLAGKILRVDKEGNVAPGNPFNNRVWSYGHRNVQGFDWNEQDEMVATEHGPSGEFDWCCHDEINHIMKGNNYGWPLVLPGKEKDTLTPPLHNSGEDTWAPSGCTFVKGEEWGEWQNNFILCGLRGQRLIRFTMPADASYVESVHDMFEDKYERIRNIVQGPDGALYFSTSNSGRGGDKKDKIYKIVWRKK